MKDWKKKIGAAMLGICLFCGCSSPGSLGETGTILETETSQKEESQSQSVMQNMREPQEEDRYEGFSGEVTGEIHFLGEEVSLEGDFLRADQTVVTIEAEGTYVVDGETEDGRIVVEAPEDAVVRIVLNGASIHSASPCAIYEQQAQKLIVSLAPGTENVLSDEVSESTSEEEEEPDATLFARDDLVINGTGSLVVEAKNQDGIKSKDNVTIVGGTISVTAEDDGIVGRDSLLIEDGTLVIQSEGDGIRSSNDTDTSKGNIQICGGTISVTAGADAIQSVNGMWITAGEFVLEAGADGIQAETTLRIDGGVFQVTTGGGSENSSTTNSQWGQWGGSVNFWGESNDNTEDTQDSAKGIKAESQIQILDGTIQLDCSDDGIHSNGDVWIAGGTIEICSGDDGIHGDDTVTLSGGTLSISKSYEGIEGQEIIVQDGTISVTASDDGMNISGGNDQSGMGGRPGQGMFSGNGDGCLTLSGGTLFVDASGDGLDANGSIVMTGGTVVVVGPEGNADGTFDFDGSFDVTGGTLIAAGSSGMLQYPDSSSGQCIAVLTFASMQAGTKCVLRDASGTELASITPEKSFQSLVISLAELKQGETYSMEIGSEEIEVTFEDTVCVLSLQGGQTGGQNGGGMFGHGGGRGNRP